MQWETLGQRGAKDKRAECCCGCGSEAEALLPPREARMTLRFRYPIFLRGGIIGRGGLNCFLHSAVLTPLQRILGGGGGGEGQEGVMLQQCTDLLCSPLFSHLTN